jgi:hypothetical protein
MNQYLKNNRGWQLTFRGLLCLPGITLFILDVTSIPESTKRSATRTKMPTNTSAVNIRLSTMSALNHLSRALRFQPNLHNIRVEAFLKSYKHTT